jgi:hypothetical protein
VRRTYRQVIKDVDDIRANVFSEEQKFNWLCELVAQLQAEEWRYGVLPTPDYADDIDDNVPSPVDYDLSRLYESWLRWRVNMAQEDYDLAEQDKLEYDQIRAEYRSMRIREHGPHGRRRHEKEYEERRKSHERDRISRPRRPQSVEW